MSKDVEEVYEACEACKENSRSKNNVPGKRVEAVPSTMELGAQGNYFVWTSVNTTYPILSHH